MALFGQINAARTQFAAATGAPLSGGSVATYLPGTSTPVTTYQDPTGATANANPVTLDSLGSAAIWYNGLVRMVVKDASGTTVYDQVGGNVTTPTVATLAQLQGCAPGTYYVAGRTAAGDGYQDYFTWTAGDQSAKVSADPLHGIWVPPSSAPSGASGAWRRTRTDVTYEMFGAKGDGVYDAVHGTVSGTDDAAAIQAAINWCLRSGVVDCGQANGVPGKIYVTGTELLIDNAYTFTFGVFGETIASPALTTYQLKIKDSYGTTVAGAFNGNSGLFANIELENTAGHSRTSHAMGSQTFDRTDFNALCPGYGAQYNIYDNNIQSGIPNNGSEGVFHLVQFRHMSVAGISSNNFNNLQNKWIGCSWDGVGGGSGVACIESRSNLIGGVEYGGIGGAVIGGNADPHGGLSGATVGNNCVFLRFVGRPAQDFHISGLQMEDYCALISWDSSGVTDDTGIYAVNLTGMSLKGGIDGTSASATGKFINVVTGRPTIKLNVHGVSAEQGRNFGAIYLGSNVEMVWSGGIWAAPYLQGSGRATVIDPAMPFSTVVVDNTIDLTQINWKATVTYAGAGGTAQVIPMVAAPGYASRTIAPTITTASYAGGGAQQTVLKFAYPAGVLNPFPLEGGGYGIRFLDFNITGQMTASATVYLYLRQASTGMAKLLATINPTIGSTQVIRWYGLIESYHSSILSAGGMVLNGVETPWSLSTFAGFDQTAGVSLEVDVAGTAANPLSYNTTHTLLT